MRCSRAGKVLRSEDVSMSVITIRNLPPHVKGEIQRRAGAKGTSMEAEIRSILSEATERPEAQDPVWSAIDEARHHLAALGFDWNEVGPRLDDEPRDITLP